MNDTRAVCVAVLALALGACSDRGAEAARRWVADQHLPAAKQPALPDFRDTSPLKYEGRGPADIFSPERLQLAPEVRRDKSVDGKQLFAELSLSSLRYAGLLQVTGQAVGLVQGGSVYQNVRVGDLLGEEAVEVLAVTGAGLAVRHDGKTKVLKINRWGGGSSEEK